MGHLGTKNAYNGGSAEKSSFFLIKFFLHKRAKRFSCFFIYLQSSFYYEKKFFGFKDKYVSKKSLHKLCFLILIDLICLIKFL